MSFTILLLPNEISNIYIKNKLIDFPKWLETENSNKYKKLCNFYNEEDKKRIYDIETRLCYYYDKTLISFKDINSIITKINEKMPKYFNIKITKGVLLEYPKDGFFLSHTDTKKNKKHIGNLLILPPKKLVDYKGGILKTDNENIKASRNKWKLIILPIGVEHSITKVKEGKRLVFKFRIEGENKYEIQNKERKIKQRALRYRKYKVGRFLNGKKD